MAASRIKSPSKVADGPPRAKPATPAWFLAGALAVAVIALYWPALQCGFVNYDDDRYVTENARVQNGLSLDNIRWAFANQVADNWHPLTVLSHMLVCQFCRLNPAGHHLANVVLHAANAALVFLLLRQLTGCRWKSFLVAALFAVHPLRVESVAWVAERKDVLSGFFGLLALIFYALHARSQSAEPGHGLFLSPAYWLAFICLALGLMSKPMLVSWPFVLLLLDYWPLKRLRTAEGGRNWKRLVIEKIPFFALAAAASIVTIVVQQHGQAMESIQNLPLAARTANAVISYCRYLGKTFWPVGLAVFYPHPRHWPVAEVLLAAGLLIGVSVLLLTQRRRHPYLLMGWLWFIGTLIPVIGIIQVGSQSIADRYTYLPSLGILILVVWGAGDLARRRRFLKAALWATALAAIALCADLTRTQLQYWQDGETLFRHTIEVTANNPTAHYNLGVALDDKGRRDEAIAQYQATLQIEPANTLALLNLGTDLDKSGQPRAAMTQYEQVIRLEPNNAKAHNDLGIILYDNGKIAEAAGEFQEAVRLAPDSAHALNSLAAARFKQGKTEEAIREFHEALRLMPDYPEAHFNLACILAKQGQTQEAIQHVQEVIRLAPNYPNARELLDQLLAAKRK